MEQQISDDLTAVRESSIKTRPIQPEQIKMLKMELERNSLNDMNSFIDEYIKRIKEANKRISERTLQLKELERYEVLSCANTVTKEEEDRYWEKTNLRHSINKDKSVISLSKYNIDESMKRIKEANKRIAKLTDQLVRYSVQK